ncbi:DUF421 domain-containing protein [Ferdinandcohnia sp. Marseille-Q9671]
MDISWGFIWKAVLIVLGGTILLRIAGRKSISQLTLAQVVIMIGIGSLLIQPLAGENVWNTLFVGFVLVLSLVVVEYAQLKFNFVEKFITGKSKIIIENGYLNEKNLRKLRFTVDILETQLRTKGVYKISDVQYATLEPNGQIGLILKQPKQPATKEDITYLIEEIQSVRSLIETKFPKTKVITKEYDNIPTPQAIPVKQEDSNEDNLFREVDDGSHNDPPPKFLQ